MKKTLFVLATVGALALTACSSDDTPDTSPGDNGNAPEATDTDNGPVVSGDFCQAIAQSDDLIDDVTVAQDELDALLEDPANWDSPETVTALHTQGNAMIEYADDISSLFGQVAREAGDAEVSDAFSTLAQYFEVTFTGLGQAAADADSVMDYAANMGQYVDQEQLLALTEELEEAGPIVSEYIQTTCGSLDVDF